MSDTIHIKATIEVTINNALDEEALQEAFDGNLLECAKWLIVENGLCGVINGEPLVIKAERGEYVDEYAEQSLAADRISAG